MDYDKQRALPTDYYHGLLGLGAAVIMAGKVISTPFDAITYKIIGYLAVSCCPIGLLINFGERSLRYRRVFPPRKVIDHLINRQWLFVPDWLKDDGDKV